MINRLNNRKTLYLILGIVLVSVFTLTIAYAALNTVLKITGNTEVVASSWDLYLDNPQVISGSATTTTPTITNKTTASFSTTLKNPGDYYMFTIDVVNNGSIDAMIDSIEKIPTLSESQAKYLNYIIGYQNGDSISTKQLVEANSFVRLKVKISLRTDILSTDLPDKAETLGLSFKVNYVQSDDNDSNVSINNNGKLVKVLNGNYDTTGSEICIGKECFYVISSTENDVTMLSKYNLLVGYTYDKTNGIVPITNPTGIQDANAKGWFSDFTVENPLVGVKQFSSTNYWSSTYPAYVYDNNSNLYKLVNDYRNYLENLGISISDARLITMDELENLGCVSSKLSCSNAPNWVYSVSYWSGVAYSSKDIWGVHSSSDFSDDKCTNYDGGVRPVITISKSSF